MKLEFVGQSARDDSSATHSTSRLVNWYREPAEGRSGYVLKSVLGRQIFAETQGEDFRNMIYVAPYLYAVNDGVLWQISESGEMTNLGSVPEGHRTSMSSNNGNICIVVGGRYFVWNGTSLVEPASGNFARMGSVEFYSQYTVITQKFGRKVQWSDAATPETLDALNFATTEQSDDDNRAAVAINGRLWIFKERSIERWSADGEGLSYDLGSKTDVGLREFNHICKVPDGAFWIGSDNKAHLVLGGSESIVSTPAVNEAIENGQPRHCEYYRDRGHEMCCIIFADRPAWCFDLTTSEWHERAEGPEFSPWNVRAIVEAWNGDFYAGSSTGVISRLTRNNLDNGATLYRRVTSYTMENEGGRFRVPELELHASVGLNDQLVTAPQIMVRASGNDGQHYGPWKSRSLGLSGEYMQRLRYPPFGQFRQFTFQAQVSTSEDVTLDAEAMVRVA